MNSKVFALLLIAVVGVFAEEYNCAAEGRVCQNGGVCHDDFEASNNNPGTNGNGWKTPFCICKAGFGGPDCSWTIRECKDSPCQNGGTCSAATCRPTGGGMNNYDCFTCNCPLGWTGAPAYTSDTVNTGGVCDYPLPIQDCSVNGCSNGGTCTSTNTPTSSSYSCACQGQWVGGSMKNCTVPTFNCTTNARDTCLNGGTCISNGATCSCNGLFRGTTCQIAPFCDSNPCMNGATCNPGTFLTGSCTCTSGFTGVFCDTARFCTSNPCINGGTCFDNTPPTIGGSCGCLPNYSGAFCEVPPFCNPDPCMNGATCVQGTGGDAGTGSCANCPRGWAGKFCERELVGCGADKVDCAVEHTTGYNPSTPNVRTCPCYNLATCRTSNYNQKCNCNANAFDCRCNSTFVSRCPGNAGVPGRNVNMVCQNGGTCAEWAEGTGCSCRPGFWGPNCENYDNPCLNTPCKNGGQCSMTSETGMRYSPSAGGLVQIGALALDDRFWGYMCTCKWPFYGETCELVAPRDPVVCTGHQCQNGATCGPTSYSASAGNIGQTVGNFKAVGLPYTCQCNSNYTGIYCETWIKTCFNTPDYCMNGGQCVDSSTTPSPLSGAIDGAKPACVCPCGYAGDRCEISAANADTTALRKFSGGNGGVGYRLDFCSREPCQNGGTCVSSLNGQDFWCQCKSGYGNRYCETRVRSSAAGVVPSLVAVAAAVAVAFALKH